MLTTLKPIERLSPDVIAQIKSSVTINNLSDVVIGLVRNSLDAGATRVATRLDFARGSCEIEDDGHGIDASAFFERGGLGEPYNTSKSSDGSTYGRYGSFLAAVSGVSVLTITSRTSASSDSNSLTLHKGAVLVRRVPIAGDEQFMMTSDAGVRINVRNLFGNLPVRVKQRAADGFSAHDREWTFLTRRLVGLMLACDSTVQLSAEDEGVARKLIIPVKASQMKERHISRIGAPSVWTREHTLSVLTQSGAVRANAWPAWVPLSASTPLIKLHGVISLDPAPNKDVQFISIGREPVFSSIKGNELYDTVNRTFTDSSFGMLYDEFEPQNRARRGHDNNVNDEKLTLKRLRFVGKGVDRWPMFSIKIECTDDLQGTACPQLDSCDTAKSSQLRAIIDVLSAAVTEWLQHHHFKPRRQRTFKNIRGAESGLTGLSSRGCSTEDTSSSASSRSTNGTDPRSPKHAEHFAQAKLLGSRTMVKPSAASTAFSSWSRIKSSDSRFLAKAAAPRNAKPSLMADAPSVQKDRRPSSSPATGSSQTRAKSRICDNETPRAVTAEVAPSAPSKEDACGDHRALKTAQEDEYTSWEDPMTRVRYLINKRSGTSHLETQLTEKSSYKNFQVGRHGAFTLQARLRNPLRTHVGDQPPKALSAWSNPVFRTPSKKISLASPGSAQNCGCCVGMHEGSFGSLISDANNGFNQISISGLENAQVISQVDHKFILVMVPAVANRSPIGALPSSNSILVLIDQHAADERIQVEALFAELCSSQDKSTAILSSNLGHQAAVAHARLKQHITFEADVKELRVLRKHALHLAQWGILYDLHAATLLQASGDSLNTTHQRVTLHTLPIGISERCEAKPKLAIDLVRSECWKREAAGLSNGSLQTKLALDGHTGDKTWPCRLAKCPTGIVDMLNSRACRSAIMFNDELSRERCAALVARLADCSFPFQCAHGRPSMVPLMEIEADLELGSISDDWAHVLADDDMIRSSALDRKHNESVGFAKAYTRWQGGR